MRLGWIRMAVYTGNNLLFESYNLGENIGKVVDYLLNNGIPMDKKITIDSAIGRAQFEQTTVREFLQKYGSVRKE